MLMGRLCSSIIAVLVVALVVVSTSFGYAYHRKSEKVSDAKWELTQVADDELFYMSNMATSSPT